MHLAGYAHGLRANPDAEIVGLWDDVPERAESFAQKSGIPFVGFLDDLLRSVDAVVITNENSRHVDLVEAAARVGKHILCEKPIGPSEEHVRRIEQAVKDSGVTFMTAFPCRFSPAYRRLKERVEKGEIGAVKAICATNRGRCPFDWFVEKEKSGGGSMIDHVVHVADLLRDLLGEEPVSVQAQIGRNLYGQDWEDTAMVTIEFPSGVFASLDSSWSRPQNYKTWGDVTLNVVGESGVIEVDMFGQALETYGKSSGYSAAGYGADLDSLLVGEFVSACLERRPPEVTCFDGAQAARIALAGYRSVASGQPESVGLGQIAAI